MMHQEENDIDVVEEAAVTAISVVVDANKGRLAVAALIPRKRTSADDTIKFTLNTFLFHDEKPKYHHLDALCTRLAPLSVVHLSSTDRADKNPRVASLLEKLADFISSRNDSRTNSNDDRAESKTNLVQIHPVLPQEGDLQDVLQHVLDEASSLQFRAQVLDGVVQKSLALLLKSHGIHPSQTPPTSIQWIPGALTSHLVLDRTASEAIHLLPPDGGGHSKNTNASLYDILNRCRTVMGSRELKSWLRQPLVDLKEIEARQDAVTFLVSGAVDRIRDEALQGWPNIDKLALRMDGYRNDVKGPTHRALECLYKLYLLTVQHVPLMCDTLQHALSDECDSTLLRELENGWLLVQQELSPAGALAEAVLDLEEAPRNFLVKSSFNEEMAHIKQELHGMSDEMDSCLEEMNQAWSQLSSSRNNAVKLESLDNGDYQFRLSNTNDIKLLQAHLNGVTIHRLLKNGVYFSTKELRQLSTKNQDLLADYDQLQRTLVVDAMKVASTYVPVLERTSALVAQLDVLCSLAHVAAYSPTGGYCRPALTDGDDDGLGIELKGARHPCVELQESMEYIPNDISLIFGESSFLMVTGPNMGGKSTYIRALGAIVTLAQIGAYVPCTSAKINICHHILARVGAGDLQERGISTFMAEMLEASSILRTATKRSLIIVDELGRGTSTFDGYGLATAISEYIIEKLGCMTVFATHFHELTSLEERCAEAKNCHVTATTAGSNGLTFLYEVRPGPCLESFGIQVAEMANVPAVVVADAKRKAKHLESYSYRKKKKEEDEEFLNRFRDIPMDSLSEEEKKQALLQLVQ